MAYKDAIKAEYFGLGKIQNPHIRLKDFETKPNNNILERTGRSESVQRLCEALTAVLARQRLRRGCRYITITSGHIRESVEWYRLR
jgi:hypothetical protein